MLDEEWLVQATRCTSQAVAAGQRPASGPRGERTRAVRGPGWVADCSCSHPLGHPVCWIALAWVAHQNDRPVSGNQIIISRVFVMIASTLRAERASGVTQQPAWDPARTPQPSTSCFSLVDPPLCLWQACAGQSAACVASAVAHSPPSSSCTRGWPRLAADAWSRARISFYSSIVPRPPPSTFTRKRESDPTAPSHAPSVSYASQPGRRFDR